MAQIERFNPVIPSTLCGPCSIHACFALIAPLLRFFYLSAHLPSFLLSRVPRALIVSDNPSTPIFPPQQTKPKTKN